MNALVDTMNAFDAQVERGRRDKAFRRQEEAYQQQQKSIADQNQLRQSIGGILSGQQPQAMGQPAQGGNPLAAMSSMGVTGIVPPDQAAPSPQGGNPLAQMQSQPAPPDFGAQGARYSQAADAAFAAGDVELGQALHQIHVQNTNEARKAQTQEGEAKEAAMRQTRDLLEVAANNPAMLPRVQQFAEQHGIEGASNVTQDQIPGYIQMVNAILSDPDNNVVLKDGETVFNQATGQEIYSNRVAPEGPKPTADMQNYGQAKATGYEGSFADYQKEIKQAGSSKTTVSVGGQEQTAGRKKVDEAYAKDYIAWRQGGGSDNAKLIGQLDSALATLESGKNVTGKYQGLLPDSALAIGNPDAVDTKDKVSEVVQRNLRLVLGAQFTEKEGKMLMDRAYNPQLPEDVNARRVRALTDQIKSAAEAKESAAQYFEENGTLIGWSGKQPTIGDFEAAIDSAEGRQSFNGGNLTQAADGVYDWTP